MTLPDSDVLLNICSHTVFNVRSQVGKVFNISFGHDGLTFNMFRCSNPLINFGVPGTVRFCDRTGMVGCVARGGTLPMSLDFRTVWEIARDRACQTKFKACHYKRGTNCVAFALFMMQSVQAQAELLSKDKF